MDWYHTCERTRHGYSHKLYGVILSQDKGNGNPSTPALKGMGLPAPDVKTVKQLQTVVLLAYLTRYIDVFIVHLQGDLVILRYIRKIIEAKALYPRSAYFNNIE